jgi:hypothetical protein
MTDPMHNASRALREPRNFRFVPGRGFLFQGPPQHGGGALRAASPHNACVPPYGAADWSWHYLNPPSDRGGPPIKLQWRPGTSDWHPVLGQGNRVAFASSYLASLGFTYKEPA